MKENLKSKTKDNKKTLNFKIDESLLERVNYYRKVDPNGDMSQLDFVIKALNEKCDRTKALRNGGMVLEIPNPNLFTITEEQKIEISLQLSKCFNEIVQFNPGLTFGIDEIFTYAKYHLLTISEEKKKEFKENLYIDTEFENNLK